MSNFLADLRVDVCRASAHGMTPLISACIQLMVSFDQVGAVGGNGGVASEGSTPYCRGGETMGLVPTAPPQGGHRVTLEVGAGLQGVL